MPGTAYPSDLTDEQWALLEPLFNAPGKRVVRTCATVVDAMLYIAQTGGPWRYLPESFGRDHKQPVFRPIRHAWRVEVAHGRFGRSRRVAKSFGNTTASATGWFQVACIAPTLRQLS